MKIKGYILTVSILLSCITLAPAKKIKSPFLNTVPVESDYLYAAKTEVSNLQYREFLSYVKKNNGVEAFWKLYPDSLVWRKKIGYGEPFVEYYFQHPAYKDYPVVGVSKDQATAYCNWLTEILSQNMPKGYKKIKVRLPTKKEWEHAARGGHPEYNLPAGVNKYRMGPGDKKKYQGDLMYNFNLRNGLNTSGNTNSTSIVTTPVISYWKNDYGLYNMSGNVAEIVIDDTIVKGGSWNSSAYFMQIQANDYGLSSKTPTNEVGFRYFIEVLEYDFNPGCGAFESKWILNEMVKVDSNLYAHKTECTNLDYHRFRFYNPQHAQNDSNWLLVGAKELSLKYSKSVDYLDYPAVNISYESAVAYCKWLTIETNADPKRKFKKVLFRLPTKEEWEMAARGGRKNNMYSWGGPYVRNSKGCYLANFCPIPEEKRKVVNGKYDYSIIKDSFYENKADDGGEYVVSGESYFPNSFGLYNTSGNVAEMLQVKGTAKGGSWGSSVGYIQIDQTVTQKSNKLYSGVYLDNSESSPFLGFRYFMEVLEY